MAPHVTAQTDVLPPVSLAPRLSLDPALGLRGILGGGWWPHSRDATVELPDLILLLNARVGAVVRLGVDARDWENIPRRITVGGHRVRIGWFADLNHKIIATRGPQDHIQLLVVPPHASTAAAKSALATAASGKNSGRPEEILAASGIENEAKANAFPAVSEEDGPPRKSGIHSAHIGAARTVANANEIDHWRDDAAPSPEFPARQPN